VVCAQIIQLCEIFRAKVVDVADTSLTIEITGDPGKMVAFQNRMARYGIKQLARTGKVSTPPLFLRDENGGQADARPPPITPCGQSWQPFACPVRCSVGPVSPSPGPHPALRSLLTLPAAPAVRLLCGVSEASLR
jgi:hypothetical protein